MSVERKIFTLSLFIYILAILFAIVIALIINPVVYASNEAVQDAEVTTFSIARIPVSIGQPKPRTIIVDHIYPELPGEAEYRDAINKVCSYYPNISPEIVRAMIWHESRFQSDVHNGKCVGLMQVSMKWHASRARDLGVTNFYDPFSNILVGVDYLNDIFVDCGDMGLALMIYNGDSRAYTLYSNGSLSSYASGILSMADILKGD